MELVDLLRLDHFRAFSNYWEVQAHEKTARKGSWRPGPGPALFEVLRQSLGNLPFVAEDLGDINDEVHQLRYEFDLPGMKVLQFAFGDKMPSSDHIPHHFGRNYIVYTGTHDNNTTRGWFKNEISETTRKQVEQYCGHCVNEQNISSELMRMAYASVASVAIIPMQDVAALDESTRMNTPASTSGNWLWRLTPDMVTRQHETQLRQWTKLYGRA
jgi:4-alpha-glucanotransferase